MIVWLNGPFGVGKTAVAHALVEDKPDLAVFDPEQRGVAMLRTLGDADDFQDLAAWREELIEQAARRSLSADLVIPMTVWRIEYYREILDGLKAATEVRPFRLTASEETLRERIAGDEIEPAAAEWRLRHLEQCIGAFNDVAFGDHVSTDGRTPAHIARLILATLGRS